MESPGLCFWAVSTNLFFSELTLLETEATRFFTFIEPIYILSRGYYNVMHLANLASQTLTEKYEHIIEDYRRLKSDYEEVREAREKYKKLAKDQDKNPFVLMLVDGDGYNVSAPDSNLLNMKFCSRYLESIGTDVYGDRYW